ncbi:MAG TPA: ABC-F family ATPase [Candidatus Binatia bacterium]|nr:ABC-F family ATPase [Candidatus Binatia bacterium]
MIVASGIAMQFGARPLFQNVSVKFGGGNRYGLIGANGCGKSTFMKILGGELEPSAGTVAIDAHERVGRLRQDQFAYESERVLDVVLMGHAEMWAAMRERDAIYANPDAGEAEFLRAAELEAKYAEYGGYTAEARAGELLLGLGVPLAQHAGPMSAVAPGWKLRVLLAQALFGDPDILLLDEPTNNLDINSIRWLEDVLNRRTSTMVIISHDRHFLSSVCTHMADVDYGEIRVYAGNYDDYMEASTLAKQQLQKDNAKAKDRIADLEDFVRRFRAHKAKARQATSRMKQIEKLKVEDVKPSSRQYPFIRFLVDPKEKLHRLAVEAKGLFYGKLDLAIEAGEKIAIVGPNGVGKSTLLQNLLKAKWAEKARVGYWPQDASAELGFDESLAEWLGRWRRADAGQDDQIVRATLGQLLFSGDDQKKSLKVISGGEAQRMMIGRLVLGMPNVMLLDEPTNHLDMEAIESLNNALDKYPGTLVFVSHDREFVSSLATRIIELRADRTFADFRGSYEEYLAAESPALAAA